MSGLRYNARQEDAEEASLGRASNAYLVGRLYSSLVLAARHYQRYGKVSDRDTTALEAGNQIFKNLRDVLSGGISRKASLAAMASTSWPIQAFEDLGAQTSEADLQKPLDDLLTLFSGLLAGTAADLDAKRFEEIFTRLSAGSLNDLQETLRSTTEDTSTWTSETSPSSPG